MNNYKVKVSSEAESKEVQELFFSLGFTWYGGLKEYCEYTNTYISVIDGLLCVGTGAFVDIDGELTIQQLRNLVSQQSIVYAEYLVKTTDGWILQQLDERLEDTDTCKKVPPQAKKARFYPHDPDGIEFENKFNQWWDDEKSEWIDYLDFENSDAHSRIVWQRDEMQGKNGEHLMESVGKLMSNPNSSSKFRSGGYVPPQQAELAGIAASGCGASRDKKHNHYFKDVSDLIEIDVYQVLRLFEVTDPCLQHIVKKALCAGNRGHKDFKRDLQDIADTAQRALDIHND